MKFFMFFVVPLLVHFSEAKNKVFILTHPILQKLYSPSSDNKWNISKLLLRKNLNECAEICDMIKNANIFIATESKNTNEPNSDEISNLKSRLFSGEINTSNPESSSRKNDKHAKISKRDLMIDNKIIKAATVITCLIDQMTIYVTLKTNCEYYFLFGKEESNKSVIPTLLAVAMPYFNLVSQERKVNFFRSVEIFNSRPESAKRTSVEEKFFKVYSVGIFQLCVSLLDNELTDKNKEKYIVSILGTTDNFIQNISAEIFFKDTEIYKIQNKSISVVTCHIKSLTDSLGKKFSYHIMPDISRMKNKRIFVKILETEGFMYFELFPSTI